MKILLLDFPDYLLDVLWETDEFRLSIQREIDAVFSKVDDDGDDADVDDSNAMESDEPRNSAEAENRIFARAKNASDYLGLACSVIEHLKSKNRGRISADTAARENVSAESGRDRLPPIFQSDETISIEDFLRL